MNIDLQIEQYLSSLSDHKQHELKTLMSLAESVLPDGKRWFEDGKNQEGKIISNPNIGYGEYTIQYANGSTRLFYQIGLSATTKGISVYLMGLKDKNLLRTQFEQRIGKAKITGYCIAFTSINDIDLNELIQAMELVKKGE